MHADWINYLQTLNFTSYIPQDRQAVLAPLTHLAVLSVTGKDAASFLQGQTTCDIKALVDCEPRLGAYCNAKGRTISTFIIIKQQDGFLLILPSDLLDTVRKKLQMYVLRSDVQLIDQSNELCIVGIHNAELELQSNLYAYPQLKNSFLFISSPEQTIAFSNELLQQQEITLVNENAWLGLDIQAGIPWLGTATTESFVPQMLNLDKLDAISFDKGCYTGQEIVARTHYLGKNKRAMYQASCTTDVNISPGEEISEAQDESGSVGTVILATQQKTSTQLLVVLKDQARDAKNLQLNKQNHAKITLN
ncbi:MAG: folate-binding protein [Methyloprofundus sp.]|nr:folate-binding protein [Methyloprofundus sp.]